VGPLTSPICSLDAALEIALDASVIINLNASGRGRDILRALQHPAVVVDVVRNELGKGLRSNRHDTIGLDDLVTDGVVRAVSLGGGSLEIFEALVVGMAADTLDDGEAATVAYAVHSGAIAAIDERKATRICKSKYPAVALVSTTHLLACKEVLHTLGRDGLCEAVYMALRNGRMQVPPQDLEWVLDLIGTNRAAQCLSLPKSVRPVG
jgi:predicted nucleic acid-binding protein